MTSKSKQYITVLFSIKTAAIAVKRFNCWLTERKFVIIGSKASHHPLFWYIGKLIENYLGEKRRNDDGWDELRWNEMKKNQMVREGFQTKKV